MLLEGGVPPVHIEAVGAREPVDVTGAGDTVMAAYALALASDLCPFPMRHVWRIMRVASLL